MIFKRQHHRLRELLREQLELGMRRMSIMTDPQQRISEYQLLHNIPSILLDHDQLIARVRYFLEAEVGEFRSIAPAIPPAYEKLWAEMKPFIA